MAEFEISVKTASAPVLRPGFDGDAASRAAAVMIRLADAFDAGKLRIGGGEPPVRAEDVVLIRDVDGSPLLTMGDCRDVRALVRPGP